MKTKCRDCGWIDNTAYGVDKCPDCKSDDWVEVKNKPHLRIFVCIKPSGTYNFGDVSISLDKDDCYHDTYWKDITREIAAALKKDEI